jgi:sulfide:quinone oxidoreductase
MKRILILGGGAGGVSVAARLAKQHAKNSITIVEPSESHFYQPLWTLVGAGLVSKEATRRPQSSVIPSGVEWKRDSVQQVDPHKREVKLASGNTLEYDFLVVATGLEVRFDLIAGLPSALETPFVSSIYDFQSAEKTASLLKGFKGGRAVFTMPPAPIKCAGAPQKIAYLADEMFRRQGVRAGSEILFTTAGPVIFGVPAFAETLRQVVQRKGIEVWYNHKLVSVDGAKRCAVFEATLSPDKPAERREITYDYLHAVPPMQAHSWVRESGLAAGQGPQAGWLAVDRHTLRHLEFPEIFGIGDVTGVPNSKTGAAIRKQAPVVVANLLGALAGRSEVASYDGYSACPLVTGFGKGVLAEFGYEGKLMPSFPGNPARETRFLWLLKRYLLPVFYWHWMLKGRS